MKKSEKQRFYRAFQRKPFQDKGMCSSCEHEPSQRDPKALAGEAPTRRAVRRLSSPNFEIMLIEIRNERSHNPSIADIFPAVIRNALASSQ